MFSLIIDTSSDHSLLALTCNDRLVDTAITPHFNRLSKELLPSIQTLLETNGIHPSNLSIIATGIGPGSYTGTRLGCSVAKSLAFGLNIAVKPFHSPLAFLPDQKGSFAFLLPTRAGFYYILKGTRFSTYALLHSTALIPANALPLETKTADFLVYPTTHTLSEELDIKPLFAPSANLQILAQSLQYIHALPPEKIELQYLHTPH